MGRPVSGDMPIGFAGSATAGRLSGAGMTFGFLRVGLGEGVASAGSEGDADGVGSAKGVAEGEAEDADGAVVLGVDAVGDGEGPEACVGLGAPVVADGGEPTGVVVHPARTPAHSRALRAVTVRLTTSG